MKDTIILAAVLIFSAVIIFGTMFDKFIQENKRKIKYEVIDVNGDTLVIDARYVEQKHKAAFR